MIGKGGGHVYVCHFLTHSIVRKGVYESCRCLCLSVCVFVLYLCIDRSTFIVPFQVCVCGGMRACVCVTKGRQKTAKESLIPQGLNNLFDVAFLTL